MFNTRYQKYKDRMRARGINVRASAPNRLFTVLNELEQILGEKGVGLICLLTGARERDSLLVDWIWNPRFDKRLRKKFREDMLKAMEGKKQ